MLSKNRIKREKHSFNKALLRYSKYLTKLSRLQTSGKNKHRENVLEKHIARLVSKLKNIYVAIKRASVATATVASTLVMVSSAINAQANFLPLHKYTTGDFNLLLPTSIDPNHKLLDLDNDGDLDLLTLAQLDVNDPAVFFYQENIGTVTAPNYATAQLSPFGLLTTSKWDDDFAFADLDNDGDLDLLLHDYGYNGFMYFENTGTATSPAFATQAINPFGATGTLFNNYTKLDLADLDGDGDYDILFNYSYTGEYFYLENTGTSSVADFSGTLVADPFSLTTLNGTPNTKYGSVDLRDMDGDGDLDLFTINKFGNYYNENTGTTTAPVFGGIQTDPFNIENIELWRVEPTFGDVNGDGTIDILMVDNSDKYYFFENTGATYAPNFDIPTVEKNPFGLTKMSSKSKPYFVDIDNDGDFDIISSFYSASIDRLAYFENIGTANAPSFASVVYNPFGITDVSNINSPRVDMKDWDNDGDLDLLIASDAIGGPQLLYYENTGTVSSPDFSSSSVTTPFNIPYVNRFCSTVADLDNDGDYDYLTAGYTGAFEYCENVGTASAANLPSTTNNPFNLTSVGNNAVFIDFDNDNDFDLMSIGSDFHYIENTGTASAPSFAGELSNPFNLETVTSGYQVITLADLDGDGDVDLLLGDPNGDFYYYENIELNLSVTETEKDLGLNINVYPNPTTGKVTFTTTDISTSLNSRIETIDIYSLTGQKIVTFNNTNTIDISHLSVGMYTARIVSDNKTAIKKIVKK